MQAELKWLDDPEVFRVGTLPAHSDHAFYESWESWEKGESGLCQSLNGDWQFSYAVNAKSRPADFYREDFDRSGFDTIKVPGHIEMAGYDRIHYINNMYPWEGHVFRRPAYSLGGEASSEGIQGGAGASTGSFADADYNPVGCYVKEFDLAPGLCGKRVCICFEGVEQAMYLWINGQFLGYAEDSFTPSSFDLTPYIREKGNVLAVQVHKLSTAAFLEDQDFFRFFGIFRNVTLYAKPALHVEDLWAKPVLHEDCRTGSFALSLKVSGQAADFGAEKQSGFVTGQQRGFGARQQSGHGAVVSGPAPDMGVDVADKAGKRGSEPGMKPGGCASDPARGRSGRVRIILQDADGQCILKKELSLVSTDIGELSQERTENNPAEQTGSNLAERMESNPAEQTGSNPAEQTGSNPTERTESNPTEWTESNPVEQTENNPTGQMETALLEQRAYSLSGQSGREAEKQAERTLSGRIELSPRELGEVKLWDHHSPYLYTLTVELFDEAGALVEIVPCKVGFRRIEIKDKVILLNGRRLILNGVNRHEWNAAGGRCITKEDMDFDIQLFLKNHINAVRTCHYPDQIPWYGLCDENGIYVMAETNLESHGSWQKLGISDPSWNVPGSLPQWKEAVLDRARNNFETFKNHPSILFWSLGNESFAGDNLAYMNRYFKEMDPDRLVHYEGVFHNRAYEERISDVESRMYETPEGIEAYLRGGPKKPFLLCEYMHDMGNSLGGMKSYMDLLDKYEMYQGGFIWDYIDQAILVEDEVTGKKVLRYGGDFDDRPSDYEFSGNGIVFADRTEKPALQEVRYYYGLYDK